jgi:peroxiredoxin
MSEKDTTQSGESADAQQASQLGRWAQLRQKRWFRWLTDIAFFVAALSAITMWQGRDFVDAGAPAPAFELADLDGERHSLDGYAGKKTMVVFWAPWCGVCGAESDNVSRVQSWLGDRINVVSVVLGYESRASIDAFIDEQNVDYPVLLGDRQTAADYNVSAYPTMYVIDEDGNIEHSVAGYSTTLGMLWRVLL